jgi:hypothetical protein
LLTSLRQTFLYQEPSLDEEQIADIFETLVSWAEKFFATSIRPMFEIQLH